MSAESATPTLPRLPAGALNRCVMVYSATCPPPLLDDGTIDPVLFWHRHRDTPALLHNAIRLYPTAFQEFIGEHFVASNGLSPSLARSSPLHSIVGAIRPSSSQRKAVDERDRREQTLKVFLTKREDDPSLTFISTVFLPEHSAEGSPIAPLMLLPPFLTHQDLLSLPRSVAAGTSATLHQLIVGGAKTYSPTHIDYLGVAAASYLIAGEKLWLIGRPEQTHAFFTAFPPRESIPWTHLQRQKAEVIERHQFSIVHQRAGDLFYLPAGWPHAVYHLTETAMISASLLHPWNVHALVHHLKTSGNQVLDVDSLMRAFVAQAKQFGGSVTTKEAKLWQARASEAQQAWLAGEADG